VAVYAEVFVHDFAVSVGFLIAIEQGKERKEED